MLIKTENGKVISERLRRADTFISRLRGLMFKKQFPAEYDTLMITPCNAVHTMFMRYTIDVVFLDTKQYVLHVGHRMAPWRLSPVVKGAACVIETAAGSAEKFGIQVGDRLYFQE